MIPRTLLPLSLLLDPTQPRTFPSEILPYIPLDGTIKKPLISLDHSDHTIRCVCECPAGATLLVEKALFTLDFPLDANGDVTTDDTSIQRQLSRFRDNVLLHPQKSNTAGVQALCEFLAHQIREEEAISSALPRLTLSNMFPLDFPSKALTLGNGTLSTSATRSPNTPSSSSSLRKGFFPYAAYLQSSCIGNCSWWTIGDFLVLVSKRRILQGEVLNTPFVGDLTDRPVIRKAKISKSRHLRCDCALCMGQGTIPASVRAVVMNENFEEENENEEEGEEESEKREYPLSELIEIFRHDVEDSLDHPYFTLSFLFILLSELLKREEDSNLTLLIDLFNDILRLSEQYRIIPFQFAPFVQLCSLLGHPYDERESHLLHLDRMNQVLSGDYGTLVADCLISVNVVGNETIDQWRTRLEERKAASQQCNHCGQNPGNLMRCARCKRVLYCGRQCQVRDWSKHRQVCLV